MKLSLYSTSLSLRMCLGVDEERLAEARIAKLLVERVRSNIVSLFLFYLFIFKDVPGSRRGEASRSSDSQAVGGAGPFQHCLP